MAQEHRYQTRDNFILRNVAGKSVLISVGENIANFNGYINLNETAAFLWKQMTEPKTVPELASAIIAEFDADLEQAETDVREFLNELTQQDMVIINE